MNRGNVLYISGPMSGRDDYNFPAFNAAERTLLHSGWDFRVINPAHTGVVAGWEWSDYLRHDITQLMTADGVAVLEDWTDSRGARLEVGLAQDLGMAVHSVRYWASNGPERPS